jgi:hypothetical protein
MTKEQKCRQKQKEKRHHAREQVQLEDTLRSLATEERMLNDKKEYEIMCKNIVRFVESNALSKHT